MSSERDVGESGSSSQVSEIANRGGRPSMFEDKFTIMVEDHLAQGYTLETFGGTIGLSRDTIYDWARNNAEFLNAIKRGRDRGQLLWEKKMHKGADGGDCNPTMIIFAMKNQYKWRERDPDIISQLGMIGSADTQNEMTLDNKVEYAKQLREQLDDFIDANEPIKTRDALGMESEADHGTKADEVEPVPLDKANIK